MSRVLEDVVAQRLCIGCGLCAVVCPRDALTMISNERGELVATESSGTCVAGCERCWRVCPFGAASPDESEIGEALFPGAPHRDTALGKFIETRVARVADEAALRRSASGGVATWLAVEALKRGTADAVLCVAQSGRADGQFAYSICRCEEEVRHAASSAYQPITLHEVLEEVRSTKERVLVVGLPCFLKAVRRAEQLIPSMGDQIVACVGLTCGQLKSRLFTEYVALLAGGPDATPSNVVYRRKSDAGDAGDFAFAFDWRDGSHAEIRWTQGIGVPWSLRLFSPRACGYCDDVFAECADVAVMDAWARPWRQDARGTSFVVVRSAMGAALFDRADGLELFDVVEPSVVLGSQSRVVRDKRAGIAVRAGLDRSSALRVPTKRVLPHGSTSAAERLRWKAAWIAAEEGVPVWLERRDPDHLHDKLRKQFFAYRLADIMGSMEIRAKSVIKRVIGKKGGSGR